VDLTQIPHWLSPKKAIWSHDYLQLIGKNITCAQKQIWIN